MKIQPKFDYQNFSRMDELLSAIHYRGISVTGVPGNFLKDTFITTPYQLTLKKQIISFLNRIRLRYFQNFNYRFNSPVPQNGSYLFSFGALSPRVVDFALPVINLLGSRQCFITAPSLEAQDHTNGILHKTFPCITKETYRKWQKEYATISVLVKKNIHQIRKERNISLTAAIDMETNAMYQTLLYENALDFLTITNPKAILCDFDRLPSNSALVMAGNQLGIPTFTFIHGSIDPPDNYIPILSRHVFCWGNDHLQMLKQVNTSSSKMIVTGNTKLSRNLIADASVVRKKISIPADYKKTLVLFSNNIEPALQLQLAKSFIKFCENNPNVRGIIKLHPLEQIEDYKSLNIPDTISLQSAENLNMDEALSIADGIMAHNSLATIDTLIKKKPLAILNTIDLSLGIGERLHNEVGVPLISDQKSFDNYVQSLCDRSYSFDSNEKFVRQYCEAFGLDAVSKTIQEIHKNI